MNFLKRFLLIIHKQLWKKEKLIILFFVLGISISAFAQQIESEFANRPDKKQNAIYFSNGLQSKSRKYHEFRGLKTHSLEKPKTIYFYCSHCQLFIFL